ncbi:MAG: hypothetical protein ACI9O0_000690 [Paracoccaceae bacterium]|jgi:hypothetical protein
MAKFCPEWVAASVSGLVAQRFISASFGLNVFAIKYSSILTDYFEVVRPEDIEGAAESYLRFLSEIEIEDAGLMLQSYIYNRLTFDETGAIRKIKTIFGSQLSGASYAEFGVDAATKRFSRFVYAARAKPQLLAAASWTWSSIENGEWLIDLPNVEVSILDGI